MCGMSFVPFGVVLRPRISIKIDYVYLKTTLRKLLTNNSILTLISYSSILDQMISGRLAIDWLRSEDTEREREREREVARRTIKSAAVVNRSDAEFVDRVGDALLVFFWYF